MIATNLEQAKEWFKSNSEPLTLQKDSVFTSVNSYDEAILFFYSAPERKIMSLQDEISISNGRGLNCKHTEDLRLGKIWNAVSKELSEKSNNKEPLVFGTGGNMINNKISNNIWIEIESNKWVLKSGILPDKIGILLTAKDMTEEFGYWQYATYIVFNRDIESSQWIEQEISMFVLSENDESKRTKTAQLRAIDDTVTYFGKLSYTLNQLWKIM